MDVEKSDAILCAATLQVEGSGPVQCPKFGKLAKHGKGLCIWGEGAFLGELGGAAE